MHFMTACYKNNLEDIRVDMAKDQPASPFSRVIYLRVCSSVELQADAQISF